MKNNTDYTKGYNEGWDDVINDILFELSQGDSPESRQDIVEYIKNLKVSK